MTHASVFSGIGGPEVAATMLGWENLFHCEINPFGRAVLDYWYPNAKSYEDITTTDFSEWRGRIDVLTGGFPCQPFSYAGQRRGQTDDRYLWPYMFRCIDQVRPTWVVAENVAGILTMVEQGEVSQVASAPTLFDQGDAVRGQFRLRETFTLERICHDLESHGYSVQPVLIPACSVGAPHRRDRVFIIGHRIATDTDDRTDGRNAGAHEGESREERIQERHEVRKPDEPNQVRPASEGNAPADSACSGEGTPQASGSTESSRGDADQQPSERRAASERHHGLPTIPRDAADTESVGQLYRDRQEREAVSGRPYMAQTQRRVDASVGDGEQGLAADTSNGRISRLDHHSKQCDEGIARQSESNSEPYSIGDKQGWKPEWGGADYQVGERWSHFPSVSPVHRGNDGLPFPVDHLTLPFSKWRTEALKAYGNAIVPQVMYEIFRAIEQVELGQR